MAIGTARRYLTFRIVAASLLLTHLGIRLIFPAPTIFSDLILFNLVAAVAAVSAYYAPLFNDHWATISMGISLGLWAMGSFISSWNSFMGFQLWPRSTDIAYALFYPFLLFGMTRALSAKQKLRALELLDVLIIGLGISTVLASLLLAPAMEHINGSAFKVFLSILYPIGDCILLTIALMSFILQPRSLRSFIMLAGVSIFAATDLYFLWKSATSGYPFASLVDDGWVIGLLIISESLWHSGGEIEVSDRFTSVSATIALFASATILGVAAVKPGYFPTFSLIPALCTIMLAFLRMSVALRQARAADHDRELARTDELTGLANRRRFLAEVEILERKDGTLLLLDLDGFKKVNDTLGHHVGDLLLKQIALRFSRSLSHNALLARLGGDEFGVIIYGGSRIGDEVAQALRASMSYAFLVGNHELNLGLSIGVVRSDGRADLLKRADVAMYEAKRSGGGIFIENS